jgi:hypothetical protein
LGATIDPNLLPQSALLDSSVLVPALGGKVRPTDDAASGPLFNAMVQARRSVLIAAPSVAEILRKSPPSAIPRTKGVIVVPFDRPAAELLGTKFPIDILKRVRDEFTSSRAKPGPWLDYIKFDSMIVSCAVRHGAAVLVTTDIGQQKLAAKVGLLTREPRDYLAAQRNLPGVS